MKIYVAGASVEPEQVTGRLLALYLLVCMLSMAAAIVDCSGVWG